MVQYGRLCRATGRDARHSGPQYSGWPGDKRRGLFAAEELFVQRTPPAAIPHGVLQFLQSSELRLSRTDLHGHGGGRALHCGDRWGTVGAYQRSARPAHPAIRIEVSVLNTLLLSIWHPPDGKQSRAKFLLVS